LLMSAGSISYSILRAYLTSAIIKNEPHISTTSSLFVSAITVCKVSSIVEGSLNY
jgi:hypothetical protein